MGYKFRRQVVIGPCIVGFACLEAGLIIKADGAQHSDQVACDARRTMRLEGMGYRVMPPHPIPLPGERELQCTANAQIFPKSLKKFVPIVLPVTDTLAFAPWNPLLHTMNVTTHPPS
jgi:hypothetical protein